MVGVSSTNNLDFEKALNYNSFNSENVSSDTSSIFSTSSEGESIFNSTGDADNIEENVEMLQEQLDEIEAENGAILDGWNNFKGAVGIGTSTAKCDEAITQYENGEITYDEAAEIIDNFGKKQDSSLNLFANIATSIAAIAAVAVVTVATGGAALPVIAAVGVGAGAATGAVTKAGFKTADRATNEVEGDALDGKQIAKDAISGAVVGTTAAATMGTGASGVASCAKTGAITGAVAGGSNYTLDCAFDEDKDFNAKEFVVSAGTGAATGAAVGATMGGLTNALGLQNTGCNLETMISSTENASIGNVAANSASTTSYKLLNDRISSVVAAA